MYVCVRGESFIFLKSSTLRIQYRYSQCIFPTQHPHLFSFFHLTVSSFSMSKMLGICVFACGRGVSEKILVKFFVPIISLTQIHLSTKAEIEIVRKNREISSNREKAKEPVTMKQEPSWRKISIYWYSKTTELEGILKIFQSNYFVDNLTQRRTGVHRRAWKEEPFNLNLARSWRLPAQEMHPAQ